MGIGVGDIGDITMWAIEQIIDCVFGKKTVNLLLPVRVLIMGCVNLGGAAVITNVILGQEFPPVDNFGQRLPSFLPVRVPPHFFDSRNTACNTTKPNQTVSAAAYSIAVAQVIIGIVFLLLGCCAVRQCDCDCCIKQYRPTKSCCSYILFIPMKLLDLCERCPCDLHCPSVRSFARPSTHAPHNTHPHSVLVCDPALGVRAHDLLLHHTGWAVGHGCSRGG
jgi:hypothetical protein